MNGDPKKGACASGFRALARRRTRIRAAQRLRSASVRAAKNASQAWRGMKMSGLAYLARSVWDFGEGWRHLLLFRSTSSWQCAGA
jgi:hypothetical protein